MTDDPEAILTRLLRGWNPGPPAPPPEVNLASLTKAWEHIKPKPVYVFCPAADVERITAWCEPLPEVRVVANRIVPEGMVWVAKDVPFTDEEIKERL